MTEIRGWKNKNICMLFKVYGFIIKNDKFCLFMDKSIQLDSLNKYYYMFTVKKWMTSSINLTLFVSLITYVCSKLHWQIYGPILMELLLTSLIKKCLTQICSIMCFVCVYATYWQTVLWEIFPLWMFPLEHPYLLWGQYCD